MGPHRGGTMSTGGELAVKEPESLAKRWDLTVDEVIAQAEKIRQLMARGMQQGHHYGKIPGSAKPSLFKAGAEKLCILFRLDPQYASTERWDGPHVFVKTVCTLWHITSGLRMGSGEGYCSTQESKYAWRRAERACP